MGDCVRLCCEGETISIPERQIDFEHPAGWTLEARVLRRVGQAPTVHLLLERRVEPSHPVARIALIPFAANTAGVWIASFGEPAGAGLVSSLAYAVSDARPFAVTESGERRPVLADKYEFFVSPERRVSIQLGSAFFLAADPEAACGSALPHLGFSCAAGNAVYVEVVG